MLSGMVSDANVILGLDSGANIIRSINDAIDNILDELAGLRAKQHILIRRFFFEGPAIDSLVKRATQHCNARLGCSRR